MIVNISTLLEE